MAYSVPTIDEMHDFLVALAKALFPDLDVSRTSFPALFLRTVAAAATDNHAHLAGVRADLLPDTAEGDALDRWGSIGGLTRKSSTIAHKAGALRVVNNDVVGRDVTAGDELTHSSGLRFQISSTTTVSAGTSADVDIESIDTGSATRLTAGEILTFATPPTGFEEDAELQLDIDEGGDDLEIDADYRRRILARFATPPLGGAAADYVAWATALEGVATAYAYPTRAGLGTVDVAALRDGSGADRLLSAGERAMVLAELEARRPVGVTVRVLEVLEQPTNIAVAVLDSGAAAYAWDWDDQVPLSVDTWTGATRTLRFTTDRPATMVAGHRIVIADAAGLGDGAELVIESLSSTDSVILESAPAVAPLAGDTVYSGGELVQPVREALQAHLDTLGPANPDSAPYGAWQGNLRIAGIYGAVNAVDGVLDLDVEAPTITAAAIDSAFPDDDTIYLITGRRLLVRRRW